MASTSSRKHRRYLSPKYCSFAHLHVELVARTVDLSAELGQKVSQIPLSHLGHTPHTWEREFQSGLRYSALSIDGVLEGAARLLVAHDEDDPAHTGIRARQRAMHGGHHQGRCLSQIEAADAGAQRRKGHRLDFELVGDLERGPRRAWMLSAVGGIIRPP